MKISIKKRVKEKVLPFVAGGFAGSVERDVHPELEENWTNDYAIFMVDVVEPPDEERRYFDTSLFFADMLEGIKKMFGRKAKIHYARFGGKLAPLKVSDIAIRVWRKDEWTSEIEIERIRKEKVKS